ncbi:MAG: hypothetical protein MZV63_55845 [Marinilabiliales bacterium]|nr:hypothetical protein [Marinilabiliales bacterium]
MSGWSSKRRVVVLRRALTRRDRDGGRGRWPATARLRRGRPQERQGHHRLRIRRAGDQHRLRDSQPGPALPRPGRCRERLRRVEEPVGLGRLHHPRSAPLPAGGPGGGPDLQLVEPVRAAGPSAGPARGDHQPPLADGRDRPAHRACGPDDDHADRLARPLSPRRGQR